MAAKRLSFLLFLFSYSQIPAKTSPNVNSVTVLYDAFTAKPDLTSDWGYSALVEFEGKRILFDTGNNAAIFEANVKRLRVDLTRLDAVVLSHRHGDHTSGLSYLLSVNAHVRIYAPADEPFIDATPPAFLTKSADMSLPANMRYFGGKMPEQLPPHGTAWPGVHFFTVDHWLDLASHIHLISTVSEIPGFRDMPEMSLVLDTPSGPVVVVGCSHPGIENILSNLTKQTHQTGVFEVIGGLHLVVSTQDQIDNTLASLFDRYQVKRMAPGHCSGEHTMALIKSRLGQEYFYAGIGEVLLLPS